MTTSIPTMNTPCSRERWESLIEPRCPDISARVIQEAWALEVTTRFGIPASLTAHAILTVWLPYGLDKTSTWFDTDIGPTLTSVLATNPTPTPREVIHALDDDTLDRHFSITATPKSLQQAHSHALLTALTHSWGHTPPTAPSE